MKKYKIVKYKNGLEKEFFCIKRKRNWFFWEYLKFTKTVSLKNGKLSEEAYMFDSLERAENLVNKVKTEGEIKIEGETVKTL